MNRFDARRCQQQSPHTLILFWIACGLCACTDGVGTPLTLKVDDGGSALGSTVAGRSAARIDAGALDDDEPSLTAECKGVDETWRSSYVADEKRLFDLVNQLRASPGSLCPPPFAAAPPLDWEPALQCSARLRARAEVPPKGPNAGPTFTAVDPRSESRSQEPGTLRDRSRRAESSIQAEFLATNVSTPQGIFDALKEDPEAAVNLCYMSTWPYYQALGIARYGNVWVLDFGSTALASSGGPQRPPTSGTGTSGPGNSGAGGR
jgi:uncharacterized protein YkwD